MQWFIWLVTTHWLSLLLLFGVLVAVWYALKHWKKYKNNEFE